MYNPLSRLAIPCWEGEWGEVEGRGREGKWRWMGLFCASDLVGAFQDWDTFGSAPLYAMVASLEFSSPSSSLLLFPQDDTTHVESDLSDSGEDVEIPGTRTQWTVAASLYNSI